MFTLTDHITHLTQQVMDGAYNLEDALNAQARWLEAHLDAITPQERAAFSASLEQTSTNSDQSLIDSVLRLQTTRLLTRHDDAREAAQQAATATDENLSEYERARNAFASAIRQTERTLSEIRIDVAIANAHNLLGNVSANRTWLVQAAGRLPDLANIDLVQLAEDIPPMPPPRMGWFRRAAVRFSGVNLDELGRRNLASLKQVARLQVDQMVLMAHLVGSSLETIRQRQQAQRAYRSAAHLVMRHAGLLMTDPAQLLALADDLIRSEPEAARLLAGQALPHAEREGDAELIARAQQLLAS